MPARAGSADLPLHGGRVPRWLSERMARLGRVLVEALVLHHGRDEVLRRLAHPFWFQSLGCVMGMDWHSSGITTSVLGALKRGLAPVADELGLHVCGGRGRQSRRTPDELVAVGERTGLDGDALVRASRLVAKVDSAAVQDGFELYLHGFLVTDDGRWIVVQQGMNPAARTARRYHWRSEGLSSFVEEPHAAIEGEPAGTILNLTDRRAAPARSAQLALVAAGPDAVLRQLPCVGVAGAPTLPHLSLPARHHVTPADVVGRRLAGALAAAAERAPRDFADLLLTPGVGARTVQALALAAELVHGTPSRFTDPARFSLAHGGKDGHPFPVPLAVYDRTIAVFRDAVERAKLGQDDRLAALRRLDEEARRLERAAHVDVAAFLERERRDSHRHGGQSVFGAARPGDDRVPRGMDEEAPAPWTSRARTSERAATPTRVARHAASPQLALPLGGVGRSVRRPAEGRPGVESNFNHRNERRSCMASYDLSVAVAVAPDVAWARVGGFEGIGNLLPPGSVELEGSGIGALRRLRLDNGAVVVERCTAVGDRAYEYVVTEGPLPFTNYRARVAVEPGPSGARIRWSGTFDPAPGVSEKELLAGIEGAIGGLLQAAKALLDRAA